MEELQMYANRIAYLLRIRYELNSADVDLTRSVEELDSALLSFCEKMLKEFHISSPEMYGLFQIFFWSVLSVDEEWKEAKNKFGKDFDFTEEYLKEIMENRIDLNTL